MRKSVDDRKAPRRKPAKGRRPLWRTRFLAALSASPNVSAAADAAAVALSTVYAHRAKDPAFRKAWEEAVDRGADALEQALYERGLGRGIERLKFHEGQAVIDPRTGQPYLERDYSDTAAIFLLKGLRPEKYRERQQVEHVGLEALGERVLAARKRSTT